MDLNATWFALIFVLLGGYAILDGFDLGVGALHLLVARSDHDRRVMLNSIGPVWDGNEVWLLAGGGALFAAFPPVYATVFSGFYLALVLVLTALIFRAVSMEFRSKVESRAWRRAWDVAFGASSAALALLLGVAFGNVLRGVPIDAAGNYTGSFLALLNPYALTIGTLSLALFTLHGALYLATKTDGPLQVRVTAWVKPLFWAVLALYAVATLATAALAPFLMSDLFARPLASWPLVLLMVASLVAVAKLGCGCVRRYGAALAASSTLIATMLALAAASLFPRLVPSSTDLANSLTAYNSASTPRTLATMLVIAGVGMPLVLGYTAFIYHAFRGKVVVTEESY